MLTIKKAAELTGVAEHTLRAWERRYGLLEPARTASGYRVYDDQALARISAMHDLVEAGWPPRRAAAEVLRQPEPELGADPYAALIDAAARLDAPAVAHEVDKRFSNGRFERTVDQWLMPALQRLGTAWADGTVSVAGEHLVSNVVMRRLSAAYEAALNGQSGPPVLIGAPPGVDHQLGLMAFAVTARRAGLPTIYLGAQVPLEAWRDAAVKADPRAAVTAVPRHRDVAKAGQVATLLHEEFSVPVLVGGRYQDAVGYPGQRLGHDISAAAATLADGS